MGNLITYLISSTVVDDLYLLDWPPAQALILNLFTDSMSSDILILFIRIQNLTELSYFPPEMKSTLKNFHQKPIFVKFHTIPEKDEAPGTQYPAIT